MSWSKPQTCLSLTYHDTKHLQVFDDRVEVPEHVVEIVTHISCSARSARFVDDSAAMVGV